MPILRRIARAGGLALAMGLVAMVAPAWSGGVDRYQPGVSSLARAPDIRATIGPDDLVTPAGASNGKIIVRNRSGEAADVYLAPDDGTTPFSFVDTLPAGFRLTIRGVPRRLPYVIYAEDTQQAGSWGPRQFVLRRRYVWTLLP